MMWLRKVAQMATATMWGILALDLTPEVPVHLADRPRQLLLVLAAVGTLGYLYCREKRIKRELLRPVEEVFELGYALGGEAKERELAQLAPVIQLRQPEKYRRGAS